MIDGDALLRRLQFLQNFNAFAIVQLSGERWFDLASITFK